MRLLFETSYCCVKGNGDFKVVLEEVFKQIGLAVKLEPIGLVGFV